MSRIKFVKEKINGKKGMLMGLVIAAAIIISGITIFTTPTKGNGATPFTIFGYVYYQDGTPAANVFVNLTDVNNGNYSVNWTDSNGRYSITFGGASGVGWNDGDKIVGFAINSTGAQGSNDTIMRSSVGSAWLNFTIDTPITTKTLTGMKCLSGLYITLNTTFNFTATDKDGVNATYYRIWHNGWHPTPGTGVGKGNNFTKYTGNFTLWDLNQTMGVPAEEGTYYIEFYSVDKNTTMPGIEYTHNQTHIVDETLPTTNHSYGNPKVTDGTVIIGPNTPFWINATDTVSGVGKIEYSVYWSKTRPTPPQTYQHLYTKTIIFNNSNGQNRTVSLQLHFNESCFYEVVWNVTDCVGHKITGYHVEFTVDAKEPLINISIKEPSYVDNNSNLWINCSTPIWINVTDEGCPYDQNITTGAKQLIIKVFWNETKGSQFQYNYTIVVNDGDLGVDLNPDYGKISYKLILHNQCYHELRFTAIDYVDNENKTKTNPFFVDCKPPWINKTIPKIVVTEQTQHNTSSSVYDAYTWEYDNQSFIAEWSYIDAVSLYISGSFYPPYGAWIEIYEDDNGQPGAKLAESEHITFNGYYIGWMQFHLPSRLYVEHGKTYWIGLRTDGLLLDWYAQNNHPNPGPYNGGVAMIDGVINQSWDFTFKIEYYPIYPYFYPMEYSFKNGSYEHNGLNNTWITSKAFFHVAYGDEGCMGGVGVASKKYRIWNNITGWTPWMNYTGPFN
ncbi:MAG: carboxypeptidase regulatory-like domain-containing protein, partial [Thermoplasmata archaeon]|nr:carboxypeptidase regulatory-like domain-containing protein [Thermoplasmata archaeon]